MSTIILDLDHTLSETKKIREEIWMILRAYGIPEKVIDSAEKAFRSKNNNLYGFLEHLEELEKMGYKIPSSAVEAYFSKSMKHHLFEGVREILEKLKNKGHRLILLSKGLDYFQRFKIRQFGLEDLFDSDIYICDEKTEDTIKEMSLSKKGKIYFINDHADETLRIHKSFGNFICIIVKSHKTKLESVKKHKKILIVEDLKEASKYIK